jgi:ATP-dependent DNA helicase RecQ
MLVRGNPTYPTLEVERFLVSCASKAIPIEESDDEKTIVFRDRLTGTLRSTWLKLLAQAYVAIDHRCADFHGGTESVEEERFLRELSKRISPSVFQLVECQRPLSTLLNASDATGFYDQRVDFSLETKDSRIVIEIDGKQHSEEKQRILDRQRQDFLEKNHCKVIRVPASDVKRNQVEHTMAMLEQYFVEDPFLSTAARNFQYPIGGEELGRAAQQLVLVPVAVARVQWALLWAFMNGQLDLGKPLLKIGVIEEDVPCAYLAVWDFINSLNHLAKLAGIREPIPKFNLEVVRNSDFESYWNGIGVLTDEPHLKVHISNSNEIDWVVQNPFDLVIAVSTLHVGKRKLNYSVGENACIQIDSVHSAREMSQRIESAPPIKYQLRKDSDENLLFFLHWIFRKRKWLSGQHEILERALALKDVIGLLPTGGGKSLCYQLAALLQPGMTLIVDPLRSLMYDQIENLRQSQIDAAAFVSGDQNADERERTLDLMAQRSYILLFISPERLQIRTFRKRLEELCLHTPVPYLVIDEVHCVSEWGHDFRPSYLKLAENARRSCVHHGLEPSIIALTGTASWVALSDIQREINVSEDEAIVTPQTFDRPELEFEVIKCGSDEKISKLRGKLLEMPQRFDLSAQRFFQPENSGIVFCPHVNGEYGTTEVANQIAKHLSDLIPHVPTYSGKSPHNQDPRKWDAVKLENQRAFKENKVPLIVATKAFGMGIDKPNVRYTIHYNIPISLEAFYQEAGRAGRDGRHAVCIILFSGDLSSWKELYDPDLTAEKLANVTQKRAPRRSQDDIYRMLYFHTNTWRGEEREFRDIMDMMQSKISPAVAHLDYDQRDHIVMPFSTQFEGEVEEDPRTRVEKVLYRLSILGLVADYTLDYNAKQFEVEIVRRSDEFLKNAVLDYVARYKPIEYRTQYAHEIEAFQHETVLGKCVGALLKFVYIEIEKKRRRAIVEMADVASTMLDNDAFRSALLNYLEMSEFTQKLIALSTRMEPKEWVEIASEVQDIDSSRHLLGGCRRSLESYPDHPGLLILSAFSRLIIPNIPDDRTLDEFERGIRMLARAPPTEGLHQALAEILQLISTRRPQLVTAICHITLRQFPQREIARTTLRYTDTTTEAGMLAWKTLMEPLPPLVRRIRTHMVGGELA